MALMVNGILQVPLLIGVAVGLAMAILLAFPVLLILMIRSNVPEALIFQTARQKGLPVLSLVDIGSGRAQFFLGKKDKNDDIAFDTKNFGIQVDPSLTSGDAEPLRYKKGLNIYHYSTVHWLPLSPKNAHAIANVEKLQRKAKYGPIQFLTIQELMCLLNVSRENLAKDAKLFVERYQPRFDTLDADGNTVEAELTSNELTNHIVAMQDELANMPIETGYFSFRHAFKAIPFAHAAQDLEQLKLLIEKKLWKQFLDKDRLWTYVIMALVIIAGAGVAIYIGSLAAKNVV